MFSSLLVFAILWGGGFQTFLLGGPYNTKRYGFLHIESKSTSRKLVESSSACASFPSPYINVFRKGFQLYSLFSRPSSEKLSQSVIDGISVLGGQYHGTLFFCNSSLISSFYVNVTLLCGPKAVARTPFPFSLVMIFFQDSCMALMQGGGGCVCHLFVTELAKFNMGFLHCICLFIVE